MHKPMDQRRLTEIRRRGASWLKQPAKILIEGRAPLDLGPVILLSKESFEDLTEIAEDHSGAACVASRTHVAALARANERITKLEKVIDEMREARQRIVAGFKEKVKELGQLVDKYRRAVPHSSEADAKKIAALEVQNAALIDRMHGQSAELARSHEIVANITCRASSLLAVARSCLGEYSGGYRSEDRLDAYRHGMRTVITALEEALRHPENAQVQALLRIADWKPLEEQLLSFKTED